MNEYTKTYAVISSVAKKTGMTPTELWAVVGQNLIKSDLDADDTPLDKAIYCLRQLCRERIGRWYRPYNGDKLARRQAALAAGGRLSKRGKRPRRGQPFPKTRQLCVI